MMAEIGKELLKIWKTLLYDNSMSLIWQFNEREDIKRQTLLRGQTDTDIQSGRQTNAQTDGEGNKQRQTTDKLIVYATFSEISNKLLDLNEVLKAAYG